MLGKKGEKAGKMGVAAMEKEEMGAMVEENRAGAEKEAKMEDKKATVTVKGETVIEKGAEKEKGRATAVEDKGRKQGRDHLEPWWDACASFSQKEEAALEKRERKERQHWPKTRTHKGVMAAMEEVKGETKLAKEVTGEDMIFLFKTSGRMITLMSSDGKQFKMLEEAARLSTVLVDMIDDKGFVDDIIPLPNVSSTPLATVINYCNKHATDAYKPDAAHNSTNNNNTTSEETLQEWDRKLMDGLTQGALYDIIKAANYLDISGLLDILGRKVADTIKNKTPEQLRVMFNITDSFTKEEEEEVRKENEWAFNEN